MGVLQRISKENVSDNHNARINTPTHSTEGD